MVTGGASGLGAATVAGALAAGARVVIIDLPSSPVAELAAGLGDRVPLRRRRRPRRGPGAGRHRRGERARRRCGSRSTAPVWPRPAGSIGKRGVLPLEDFRTVIEINLVGTFNVLRLAAPR